MQPRDYRIYDVFTDRALSGNPLAVVVHAEGLDDAAMQAIAREFNLSETVFLLPPENPGHRARVRIFTADYEMPFAGHPTVGAAIALAHLSPDNGTDAIFMLEENIGPVRCAVSRRDGVAFAEFDLPRLPEPLPLVAEPEALGSALGLSPDEIGFENHRVGLWSAGVPYITVPVSGLAAAAKARINNGAWMELAPRKSEVAVTCAYVYCRETVGRGCHFHARMFVPGNTAYEDPATGSAAAAFAGAIAQFDTPLDGSSAFWIEQGIEMGRPSRIRLELEIAAGNIAAARIGGSAVLVAQGVLHV